MDIVFRADASSEMGTGHVMRCLTLAEALRARGARCLFLCREHPGNLLEHIRGRGFEARALPLGASPTPTPPPPDHAAWLGAGWEEDAHQSLTALEGLKAAWLITDHYALDERWESAMRGACRRLMVIDDLADRRHDCDLLLDQNLQPNGSCQYKDRVPAGCRLLLGPQYALLRPEFQEAAALPRPARDTVRSVMVFLGGSDPGNVSELALDVLSEPRFRHLLADIIIGPLHPALQAIRLKTQARPGTQLHINTPRMASIMVSADLAIGAGGSTTWERLALGLPSLVITIARNQLRYTRQLQEAGALTWLGNAEEVTPSILSQALAKALREAPEQSRKANEFSRLVSVHGAGAVATALCHHVDGAAESL